MPYHGGAWNASDTKTLLDAVQPSVVVISVGTVGEKYKHPNQEKIIHPHFRTHKCIVTIQVN
jgi:beta-lactamase superfamily II metal-dependent hydrolase